MNWNDAMRLKIRARYEEGTDTIRLVPENYCLAHRVNGRWSAYRDEGATRDRHDDIQRVLDVWQSGSTGQALASVVGELFRYDEAVQS